MGINSPKEIAQNYVAIGKTKANLATDKMFLLAVIAGAFIATVRKNWKPSDAERKSQVKEIELED